MGFFDSDSSNSSDWDDNWNTNWSDSDSTISSLSSVPKTEPPNPKTRSIIKFLKRISPIKKINSK